MNNVKTLKVFSYKNKLLVKRLKQDNLAKTILFNCYFCNSFTKAVISLNAPS
jgi:hypothetical protein